MLLEVTGFSKRFGGLVALSNVDLAIEAGAIHGVIGPNGSGKSTLFNLISGVYRPEAGGTITSAMPRMRATPAAWAGPAPPKPTSA